MSRFTPRHLTTFVLVASLSSVSIPTRSAMAQSKAVAASPQVRYRQAHDAFKAGKWTEAQRLLLELWKEKPSFDVAVTLVQVEYQLGHFGSAARYLQFAIANIPPTEKPDTAAAYRAQLEELRPKVAEVNVEVDTAGAEIQLNGERMGTTPLDGPLFVDPGNHTVTARAGERVSSQRIIAERGSRYAVELKISSVASGLTPSAPPPASAPSAPATPPSDRDTKPHLAILGVGGGLTLLATTVGVVYAVRGSSKQSDVDRLKGEAQQELGGNCATSSSEQVCRDLSAAAEDRNSSNGTARIAFIASGVLLAGTAVTYFLWPKGDEKTTAHIFPVAAPRFAGLTVSGAF